jgi:hypothetical protein
MTKDQVDRLCDQIMDEVRQDVADVFTHSDETKMWERIRQVLRNWTGV